MRVQRAEVMPIGPWLKRVLPIQAKIVEIGTLTANNLLRIYAFHQPESCDMKLNLFSPARCGVASCGVLLALGFGASAATISVAPNSVSNLYSGTLTVQLGGLTNGETVLVEHFLDPNGNGVVDAGEPRVQSFLLTDGQGAAIGGVRDTNIPGDNDLVANGQITATLDFANSPEFSRGAGTQIFRVSSPVARFAAVQQSITITQASLPRKITGTISSSGSPIPFAWAAALLQVGNDQQLVSATTADASGNFTLKVTNGTYGVIGFKPGYTGNFGTSPLVTISGVDTNVSIPLTAGSLNISGSIVDTASGHGIPGVQCFATSDANDYAVLFSDAQGNFSLSVNAGQWKLDPSDYSAMLGGYLRAQNKTKVTVSTTSVTGVTVPFTKGTALIYGTLKTDQNVGLGGVRLYGNDSLNTVQSTVYTDASGNFFLPASNATWYFGVDQGAVLPAGYIVQQAQATLGTGQALHTNLVATRATAYLAGRAVDGNNNPINNGSMIVFASTGPNQNAQLGADGSFVFPLTGGTWTLSLDSQTAASLNLVAPQIQFNVTDGSSISNILYVAPLSTRTISGTVKSATNSPISGVGVFASTTVNGTNFNVNADTDGNGNYSLPVLAGVWSVGVDSQGLTQRGYPSVQNQNVDTTSGNQSANFIVGGGPIGTIFFRQAMGVVGEFGHGMTPAVSYPVTPKNYRVMFQVFDDTNPPAVGTVLFTGPPGSGLTNSAADPTFGVVQNGTNVFYLSQPVKNPATAQGGQWMVSYRNIVNTFQVPDPQVNSRMDVPVPTITISNGLLSKVSWSYRDANGNPVAGIPAFITTTRVDLFDQNGNLFDSQASSPATSYSYSPNSVYAWANIGLIRTVYYDTLTNQYFFNFSESSPSLTGAALLAGHTWQFLINVAPAQNYTVQYATTLGPANWTTLYVTNGAASPFKIVDPGATNS